MDPGGGFVGWAMGSSISGGSSVSVGSSISVLGGIFASLCLRQLSQEKHPVHEEGKGPRSWSTETSDSESFEERVPRNSAHKCTAPATTMLIQEVRWCWNRTQTTLRGGLVMGRK